MRIGKRLTHLAVMIAVVLVPRLSVSGQPMSMDSSSRLAKPYASMVDSVRKKDNAAVMLVLLQHQERIVRAGAFPMFDERVGNDLSVNHCFPDVTLKAIEWTFIQKLSGSGSRLNREWTYLVLAKTTAPPSRVAAPPGRLCGRQ